MYKSLLSPSFPPQSSLLHSPSLPPSLSLLVPLTCFFFLSSSCLASGLSFATCSCTAAPTSFCTDVLTTSLTTCLVLEREQNNTATKHDRTWGKGPFCSVAKFTHLQGCNNYRLETKCSYSSITALHLLKTECPYHLLNGCGMTIQVQQLES